MMENLNVWHKIFTSSLGIFLFLNVAAQKVDFTEVKSSKDWDQILTNAKSQHKNIFLDIYATWCGPCKKMDAEVYSDSSVAVYYNSTFVPARINGETEFGRVLAQKYNLTAYPSMYFVGPDGSMFYSIIGYHEGPYMIQTGDKVASDGSRLYKLSEKFSNNTISRDETEQYLKILNEFGQTEKIREIARNSIKNFTLSDYLDPKNRNIIIYSEGDMESDPPKTILAHADSMLKIWGKDTLNSYLTQVFNETMGRAIQNKDSLLMEKIITGFIPVFMQNAPAMIQQAGLTTRKIYFAELKDWKNYISAVEGYYDSIEGSNNPDFLYKEAYYIVENRLFTDTLFNKSLEWLNKVVEVKPGFDAYFLGAMVNTYKKDYDSARVWATKAELLARSDDDKQALAHLDEFLKNNGK